MTEERHLTQDEFSSLIADAPETEKRNLLRIMKDKGIKPFDFFKKAVEQIGIIINGRPIYFSALTYEDGKYTLWTVANKNIKEQFSFYRSAKKLAHEWAKKYKKIYATMEKVSHKNIAWTKKIGFKTCNENNDILTLCLIGG